MEKLINEFSAKIFSATGRKVRESEIAHFVEQVEHAGVFTEYGKKIQFGLCDFQTLSGRAEIIEVYA